jgi:hypothetical protein
MILPYPNSLQGYSHFSHTYQTYYLFTVLNLILLKLLEFNKNKTESTHKNIIQLCKINERCTSHCRIQRMLSRATKWNQTLLLKSRIIVWILNYLGHQKTDLMCCVREAPPMDSLDIFCTSWTHTARFTPNTVHMQTRRFHGTSFFLWWK